ncbi:MAG TPA: hypothetical protein DCR40_19755 [Prolixibacteraceae bacterium]|nr:hypothetical protein [Prolixibacteraceae bacterium]
MKTQKSTPTSESGKFIWPLLIATVITLFLFYIDEGYHNFRWMLNVGNWIAFLFYVAVIYGVQLLLTLPFFRFAPKFIIAATKFILIILAALFLTFIVFR